MARSARVHIQWTPHSSNVRTPFVHCSRHQRMFPVEGPDTSHLCEAHRAANVQQTLTVGNHRSCQVTRGPGTHACSAKHQSIGSRSASNRNSSTELRHAMPGMNAWLALYEDRESGDRLQDLGIPAGQGRQKRDSLRVLQRGRGQATHCMCYRKIGGSEHHTKKRQVPTLASA